MQLKINFISEKDIILPYQYNHILQASLLSLINDEKYADFIHNIGYAYEKRNFKLYTFSRIIGRAQADKLNKKFNFKKSCALFFASMDDQFVYYAFSKLLDENGEIKWLDNIVRIQSIEVLNTKEIGENIVVKTVSPITTYSTLFMHDGQKKTYYYSPFEKEFEQNIAANLRKKYIAFYKKEPEDDRFQIKPIREVKDCGLVYKGTLTKGYTGIFALSGSKEMLSIALAAGLGSRNSIGFGMVILTGR